MEMTIERHRSTLLGWITPQVHHPLKTPDDTFRRKGERFLRTHTIALSEASALQSMRTPYFEARSESYRVRDGI